MIPIRNKWGRIIAYTARYIGDNKNAPKYINSATCPIYSKGENLFGIDRVSRLRNVDYIIVVEGAPDVLRMQSIGYDNTVAALGTSWTDNQFEQLKSTPLRCVSYRIQTLPKESPTDPALKRSWQTVLRQSEKDSIRQSGNCLS